METLLEDLCAQFLSGHLTSEVKSDSSQLILFILDASFMSYFFFLIPSRLTDSSYRFYESDYCAIKTENRNSITELC